MRTIASHPGFCLFLALSFFFPALSALAASDATTSTNPEPKSTTTAWQSEPNGRGTFSLIFSCLATLTLCVWSALHLNVPAKHTGLRGRVLEKAKWVLYGIFAPELVVATAAAQFIVARWLKKEIEKDAKHRAEQSDESKNMTFHTWDMTQCFYAVMGGFAADSPWVGFRSHSQGAADYVEDASLHKRVTITPEGIRLLSFLGRLPHIHEAQIEDKSKADWMAKSIICIQAGWMVIQVLGRAIKHMPVSLLEINTCGHVACAMAIYLLWWSKPLDIMEPTILNHDQDNDPISLMYLCSSIGAVHGITDIRCFIHVANEQDKLHLRLPSNDPPDNSKETPKTPSEGQITTYLSIGSPGSRNPSTFLGFDDLWSGEENFVPLPRTANRAFRYNFDLDSPPTSTDCQVYYSPPYTNPPQPSLRHSHYCRRALQESRSSSSSTTPHQPHTPLPLPLLASASKAADLLRSECSPSSRPSYQPYYFTFVPSLGLFLGETDYIVPNRIANFPSLHNLGLGQVNIHRDRLRSVLAITAAAYGALHCSGWPDNHTIFFPTPAEKILWVVSSLTIAASGALLWGFYSARQLWPGFDRWVSGVTPGVHIESVRRERRLMITAKRWTMYGVLVVFALARVYLVVEAFISLRSAPVGLYDTPEWTDFLPHL